MSLATKEVINNEAEIDEIFQDVKDGKRSVILFNKKVFLAAVVIIIQLEVVLFFASLDIQKYPLNIWFDWGFFLQSQQVEIVPVIIAGMSASSNIKIKKMRDQLSEENRKVLEEKNTEIKMQNREILNLNKQIYEQREEIFKLKIQLDDLAATRQATQDAIDRAESIE